MSTPGAADDALRIGNREREQAITVLHDAVGAGYLDLGEFEERSTTVYAAKTRSDLRSVLADLPTGVGLFSPPAGPGALAAQSDRLPIVYDVDWTTVKRRGVWSVPPYVFISGTMGGADLDFRTAELPPGGCLIEVAASWSTVKLHLAGSHVVSTEEYTGGSMSQLKNKAGPPTAPGGQVITLRGGGNWTTVVIRRS